MSAILIITQLAKLFSSGAAETPDERASDSAALWRAGPDWDEERAAARAVLDEQRDCNSNDDSGRYLN